MLNCRFLNPCRRHIRHLSSQGVKWKSPSGHRTNMKVYNRLTNSTVDLCTRISNTCSWYCCGPTVYDSPHLGHARCYMQFDIIRRIMENIHGINVIMLMSVTDIDDKIINRANESGVDFREIALQSEREFFDSMSSLNIIPPTLAVRVSQHMPDIIEFISRLVENGYGYQAKDGSIYFSVDKYSNYGKLSPAQERETSEGKESNLDFALWKASKPGEPFWESPWGKGRPGWHIECSAMASKYFGNAIDIHSGGIDLLFPHHENEDAQSCAYHGCTQWVNYWLHSGHVHLRDDVKMSKSLKNTVSISSFLEDYSPEHLRMLCMLVPYRNGIEYSPDVMVNATSVFAKIVNFLSECDSFVRGVYPKTQIDDGFLLQELDRTQNNIINCLSNDFNTSGAMSEIINLMSSTTSELNSKQMELQSTSFSVLAISNFVKSFLGQLGFFSKIEDSNQSAQIEHILQASLNLRTSVRNVALSENFSTEPRVKKKSLLSACDEFRNEMKNAGIEIKDRANVSTWSNLPAGKSS